MTKAPVAAGAFAEFAVSRVECEPVHGSRCRVPLLSRSDSGVPATGDGEMPKEVVARSATMVNGGTVTDELGVVWNAEAESVQVFMKSESDDGGGSKGEEWYSDPLTRAQVNQLIQVLRRARDRAFGADA